MTVLEPKAKARVLYVLFGKLSILCVNQILESKPYYPSNQDWNEHIDAGFDQAKKYWEEVKKELKKLNK